LYTPADSFTKDAEVYTVAEDGTQELAPDNAHVLENGATITTVSGIITEVVEAPETEEETVEEAEVVKQEVTDEDIVKIAEALDIAGLIARIEALEAMNAEMKSANETLVTENTAMKAQYSALEVKLSTLPGSNKSINDTDDSEVVVNTRMNVMEKVAFIKSLKK
jgi:hypothetical protein